MKRAIPLGPPTGVGPVLSFSETKWSKRHQSFSSRGENYGKSCNLNEGRSSFRPIHFTREMASLFLVKVTTIILVLSRSGSSSSSCRNTCGSISINYPFGIDDGCGSPHFRGMLNCSQPELFFLSPSGSYKVQRIDYPKKQMVIYDPAMSTCSILQPHHDFVLTDIQSALIPPSSDTVFALLNCSVDSPVLNHYSGRCFNFSGHSCDELYSSCNAFRVFRLLTNSSPPCCFTSYDTVHFMSMNILDCSHYATVINTDGLRGIGPLDWVYGIKLSYGVPDTGCGRCSLSGGTCGFDTETLASQCLCSPSINASRECGEGSLMASDRATKQQTRLWTLVVMLLGMVHQLGF